MGRGSRDREGRRGGADGAGEGKVRTARMGPRGWGSAPVGGPTLGWSRWGVLGRALAGGGPGAAWVVTPLRCACPARPPHTDTGACAAAFVVHTTRGRVALSKYGGWPLTGYVVTITVGMLRRCRARLCAALRGWTGPLFPAYVIA